MNPDYRCLLVGNPNCGKSTLFNRLTGLRQKTGNFQGVTVDKHTGIISGNDGLELEVVDLPGAFSLFGVSEEKRVLSRFLTNRKETDRVVFILDSVLIERSFQFLFQVADLGIPLILVLTMKDILDKRNISLDLEKLKKELGVEAVFVNGKSGEGIEELKEILFHPEKFQPLKRLWTWDKEREDFINSLKSSLGAKDNYYVIHALENSLKELSKENTPEGAPGLEYFPENIRKNIIKRYNEKKLQYTYQDELIQKSMKIKQIVSRFLNQGEARRGLVSSADKYLLHPWFGLLVFFILIASMFQALFVWSEIPMKFIEGIFNILADLAVKNLPEGPFAGLIAKGIIGGVGSVMVFIPQIALLFFFIGILEESGYIARASFLMDRFMGRFGLSGKSFIPLLSSAACAVPAILSAKSIENKSDRMTTILISPLITCSARYPVYILIISTVFPDQMIFGFISLKAIILFGLFMLGLSTALVFGLIFKKTFFKEHSSYFILELPSYKFPSIKILFMNLYAQVKAFVTNSGKIILYASVLLWFLASNPVAPKNSELPPIQYSYAAKFGKFIEPVIEPLGFDWKIGVGILTSLAAREVMVSTLSILYGVEEEEGEGINLSKEMQKDINPKTGKEVWTILTGISVLIFYAYACQCMSTLAVVKKETKSFVWPIFLFTYMTVLAYLSSFAVFQVGNFIFIK